MRIGKQLTICAGMLLLALATTPAIAQPGGGGGGFGGGRGGGGPFGDPEQFFQLMDENGDGSITMTEFSSLRERMAAQRGQGGQGDQGGQRGQGGQGGQRGGNQMERLQEQLGATADEWAVLEPLIQAVVDAQRDLNPRGRGGRGGFGGGGFGGGNDNPELASLRTAVDSDASDIAAKLKAYREARKAKEEVLEKAQEELQAVVTPKQEAILVMGNILE